MLFIDIAIETMSEPDNDTATEIDGTEVKEEVDNDCHCGIAQMLHHKRYHVILDLKEAQTNLDKLIGQLELLNELINAEEADSDNDSDENA